MVCVTALFLLYPCFAVSLQFKVYSGYYYILAVIFLFSGVYRLSKTGWVNSFKLCWGSQRGAHNDVSGSEDSTRAEDDKCEGGNQIKPLLSQEANWQCSVLHIALIHSVIYYNWVYLWHTLHLQWVNQPLACCIVTMTHSKYNNILPNCIILYIYST